MEEERNTELTQEEAVELIQRYRQETGKTQSAIATELGISDGALSGFLAGTYKAPHRIIPKVEALLRVKEQRKVTPKEPGYVETTVARAVRNCISYCHLQGKIAVVYGDAGVGKTQAVRAYLRENSLAIGITVSPTFASITGVNELIADQLGIRERIARKMYLAIIEKLRGSGRVLVIDEAQHLTVRALNHLRCISDESGIGIAFVGNAEVYTKLKGSGRADFAQLFSRIGMRREVLTTTTTVEDIHKVFAEAALEEEALELLYKIARTSYGLRGAVNVFVNAAAVFGTVDGPAIARMGREMNIG